MIKEISEKDWKLFREKLPIWQDTYMDKLNQEYIEILSSSNNPADKFWGLEKRINTDKHKIGVACDMRRSKMVENITSLITEGVITIDDISEFSDNLKATVQLMLKLYKGEQSAEDNGWNNFQHMEIMLLSNIRQAVFFKTIDTPEED